MNITIKSGKYKSLKEGFKIINLPSLCIISGVNGSGKSQFLKMIFEEFTLNSQAKKAKKFPTVEISNIIINPDEVVYSTTEGPSLNVSSVNLQNQKNELAPFTAVLMKKINNEYYVKNKYSPDLVDDIIEIIESKSSKDLSELNSEEIEELIPFHRISGKKNSLNITSLSSVFLEYRSKYLVLFEKLVDHSKIISTIGEPPWDYFNKQFNNLGLSLKIEKDSIKLTNYQFTITNTENNENLKYADLSSGEKTILQLIVWIFKCKKQKQVPKLILFDEIDSHLHPSYIKKVLKLIEDVFVTEHKIRVIITTHSPSTIAFSPITSLYEMNKNNPRLIKVKSKTQLVSKLSDGFITILKKSKFVFIESKVDRKYYEAIYEIIRPEVEGSNEVNLNFMTPTKNFIKEFKSGGKSPVEIIVETLKNFGLEGVTFAIVDKDKDREIEVDDYHIIRTERYCIENYIFDPISIYARLIIENKEDILSEMKSIISKKNINDLKNLGETELKRIADFITKKLLTNERLKDAIENGDNLSEEVNFYYSNNKKIKMPRWYKEISLKEFKKEINSTFSISLNLDKIIEDLKYTEFISKNYIDIFNELIKK